MASNYKVLFISFCTDICSDMHNLRLPQTVTSDKKLKYHLPGSLQQILTNCLFLYKLLSGQELVAKHFF